MAGVLYCILLVSLLVDAIRVPTTTSSCTVSNGSSTFDLSLIPTYTKERALYFNGGYDNTWTFAVNPCNPLQQPVPGFNSCRGVNQSYASLYSGSSCIWYFPQVQASLSWNSTINGAVLDLKGRSRGQSSGGYESH